VEAVASLPCCLEENVDRQRGKRVFGRSLAALQRLNVLGYGQPGSGLTLNLVSNPQGTSLPPVQGTLEAAYWRALGQGFGIVFNRLLTITNLRMKRFGGTLISQGPFGGYMDLLKGRLSAAIREQVMRRDLICVDWRDNLFDCDFNQQLGLPMHGDGRHAARAHLRDLLTRDFTGAPIRVADHCYGCTASRGSSSGGTLAYNLTERAA
jgi:radical SAM/Cys-rich protein